MVFQIAKEWVAKPLNHPSPERNGIPFVLIWILRTVEYKPCEP
jgi:hypothetical protein